MTDQPAEEAHRTGRSVRLDTLVRLRWLAVIGQTTAVLVVYFGLDYELPIWACLAVIALAAWLNVALRIRFPMMQRLEPDRAAWLLAFDIAELAVLFFFTRGKGKPFAVPFSWTGSDLGHRAARAYDSHARRLRHRLRHRAGVRARPAAMGQRTFGLAGGLCHGGLAFALARDCVHRHARLANHRGVAPARGRAGGDRTGAGPRAAPFAARRARRGRR